MNASVKVKLVLLLFVATAIVGVIGSPVPVYAENNFECNSFSVSPNPLYIDISADGTVSAPNLNIVAIAYDPAGDPLELRNPDAYILAWKNVNWATWSDTPFPFDERQGTDYIARINGFDINATEKSRYEFRVETSTRVAISNCNPQFVDVVLRDESDRDKDTNYGKACADIAGGTIKSDLALTHFTCASAGGSAWSPLTAITSSSCVSQNENANQLKCENLLQSDDGPFCIPCATAQTPDDGDDVQRLRDLEHGDVCIEATDSGKICSVSANTYTCMASTTMASLRCLGTNLGSEAECIAGENECASFIPGSYIPLSCIAKVSNVNKCSSFTCNVGSYVVNSNSECANLLGVAEAICVGPKEQTGFCVNADQFRGLLQNNAYVSALFQGLGKNEVLAALQRLGGFNIVDPEGIVDPEAPDFSDSSDQFGIRNCPYADEYEAGKVRFKPSDGVREGTAEYDRQYEEFGYCLTCVSADKGQWTALGCIVTTPEGIFTSLIRIGLGVMGGVALLRMIWLGIMIGRSEDEGKIQEGWKGIYATLGGIAVVIFSVLILRIIAVNILNVVPPGFFGI